MVDPLEMRRDEIADLRAELIHQERTAGAQHALRRSGDSRPHAGGQRREGKTRQHVVGGLMAVLGNDPLDIRRRSMDRDKPRIRDRMIEIANEIGVGVDRDQHRVRRHPLQDRATEGADAWPVFDEQLATAPVDRAEHFRDQAIRRGDDRPHHHRMLQETGKEHLPRTGDAGGFAAAAPHGVGRAGHVERSDS